MVLRKGGQQGLEVPVYPFSRVGLWVLCSCFAGLDVKGSTRNHKHHIHKIVRDLRE